MDNNQTFYFDPSHTQIVRGAKGSAIYDFAGGEVIPIPLEVAENVNYKELSIDLTMDSSEKLKALIESFYYKSLGGYAPYAKILVERDVEKKHRDFAWFELTEQCNLKCVHCYGTCGPDSNSKKPLNYKAWLQILAEVRKSGFERIQFIGGEPLMSPHLIPLLYEASNMGFPLIEVFSNLTLLKDEILNCIKACDAQLATTLYSADPQIHDGITGMEGSFEQTTQAIRRATRRNIPLRVSCIVMHENEGAVGDLKNFVESLGGIYGGEDLVRPTGRGAKSTCRSTIPRHAISQPFYTSQESFNKLTQFNSCWHGKIAITDQGDVMPCIFARDQIAGNLLKSSLEEILETMQSPSGYWSMDKDQIEICKDCEFRYACSDCRSLASDWSNGNLLAKTYGCPYDPYTATWR